MQNNAQTQLVNTTAAGFPAPKTWGISGLILVGTLEDFVALYHEGKVHLIGEAVITYNDREWLFVESYTSDEEGDPVDFQFKLENDQEMIINEEGEVIAHSMNTETWGDYMDPQEEEETMIEPWILKIVERALACEASTFPVKLQTYAQRRLLLDYYSPIFKATGYKTKLLINVVGKVAVKEEIPVIQFTNYETLIESITGLKRAKVLVGSQDERVSLIKRYQPSYKEVGCFLAVEVK